MNENLKSKVDAIAEKYADLVDKRISSAVQSEVISGAVMTDITDGIRILGHIVVTLERIDRMNRCNGSRGQGEETN